MPDCCLLAWELNGAPIPLEQGGPLRLVVPGYWGVNSVKFVGEAQVAGVEIATDGGQRRQAATLDRVSAGPAGRREFRHTFVADAGAYRLVSRATDVNGETQPEFPEPNERGYRHNGWRNPALTVEVG